MNRMHGTTIVAVHRNGVSAIAGDGQVTLGDTIVKKGAVKVRALHDERVLAGFAGAVSDAFTLLEKFEGHLDSTRGNLTRAAVETVKEWRTDRVLRNLEAMLIVADARQILTLSGMGDVISPDDPVVAVGSGGAYAQAAALALLRHTELGAEEIARQALTIAAEIDIYTSGTATVLTVSDDEGSGDDNAGPGGSGDEGSGAGASGDGGSDDASSSGQTGDPSAGGPGAAEGLGGNAADGAVAAETARREGSGNGEGAR